MSEKYCSVYIQQQESPMQAQEIEGIFQNDRASKDEKQRALQHLIINIMQDDSFPRMVMSVIKYLVPIQQDTHDIKKILLYYWEIIEKVKPDGELRDEMILICNNIRKDLLHPNEWVRGRTLRLVSRIMYRGILEPISSAIMDNLEHKQVYVKRNAVVAVNRIYMHFGDDIICDVDESMEKILQNETDLSTKRNAFQLLFYSNQQKALEYLNNQIQNETAEEMGDILQLSVLELFRKTCKFDPSQKTRLIKAVFYFSKSKNSSVLLECANTLVQISTSPQTIRTAIQIYIQILLTIPDNNVKIIVLDKIIEIQEQTQPKFLEEQIIDITKILSNPSFDIRKKTLNLIEKLTTTSNIQEVFIILVKEVKKCIHNEDEQKTYLNLLLQTITQFSAKYSEKLTEQSIQLILESFLTNSKLSESQGSSIKDILLILASTNANLKKFLIKEIVQQFYDIENVQIYSGAIFMLGQYISDDQIIETLDQIKQSVGVLPIEPAQVEIEEVKQQEEAPKKKTKIQTVILPDGTYGQKFVEEDDTIHHNKAEEKQSKLRQYLIENSILASSLVRCVLRLLYKVRGQQAIYNKQSSQFLLIFCSLLRYYASNISKVDQGTIEQLNLAIRFITNPGLFKSTQLQWLNGSADYVHPIVQQHLLTSSIRLENSINDNEQNQIIAKQPDDIIAIRGLKGRTVIGEIDLEDEEQNVAESILKGVGDENQDFVSQLDNLVQLTGLSDPIYAEAFVHIHKYDITFEVFLLNRTTKPLQNVSVEFTTQGEIRILEKATPVYLQPNQSQCVKTSIKFTLQDIGLIFGNINYENSAGIEQAYLITKEININLIDFIFPKSTDLESFRSKWALYSWENKLLLNTNIKNLKELIEHFESQFHFQNISPKESLQNEKYICANLYADTKLDEDILINLSAELVEGRIVGYARIRAKNKGVVVNLGDQIKVLQNKNQ